MNLKYQTEIEINLPRRRVIELFDNIENLYHWMNGLKKFTHLSGTPGEVGAISELCFVMGKRSYIDSRPRLVVMQEEITERNLPHSLSGVYRVKGVENNIINTFVENGNSTIWGMDVEFIFSGFGMKLMSKLMPGVFKKQTMKNMQAFKAFAESQS